MFNKNGFKFLENRLSNREKAELILNKKMLIEVLERLDNIEKRLGSNDSYIEFNIKELEKEIFNRINTFSNQETKISKKEDEEIHYLLRCANNMFDKVKNCSQDEALAILELTTILVKHKLT